MRHADVQHLNCSIARTVGVLGERWTLLVLRQAFLRTRRFEDFQRNMGVARNILADRLQKLVEHEILERRLYQERPERYEYRLTEKGRDLYPVVVAIMRWGDRHTAGDAGPPVLLVHESCGHQADPYLACAHCGEEIDAREMRPEPGPGAVAEPDAA